MNNNDYTKVEITDKAKRYLNEAFSGVTGLYLRGFSELEDGNGVVSLRHPSRAGTSIDSFMYQLALSLEYVPFIMKSSYLPRFEQTLARLDIVDGTSTEWGTLAQALLFGLDMNLSKRETVEKYPNEEWGFKKYQTT